MLTLWILTVISRLNSMDGYEKKDENPFPAVNVKPHNNPLPSMEGSDLTISMKPFSWNVIRLKKN